MAQEAAFFLDNLLAALRSPSDLKRSIAGHYAHSYRAVPLTSTPHLSEWCLEPWEDQVINRHVPTASRLLVLGAGTGRESLPLAMSGRFVVGIDINQVALQFAHQTAAQFTNNTMFVQADFDTLPFFARSFDAIILFGIMYSAIPGRRARQRWLQRTMELLKEGGCVILCYLIEDPQRSRSRRLSDRINHWLCRLPGANRDYQVGDTCGRLHYLHAFQDQQELLAELTGTEIRELDWFRGYAVLTTKEAHRSV
jgi:2-polyprenyl-3-methyl-5-hydroxy-6-metoxy-1,4-benzoquinol methylase